MMRASQLFKRVTLLASRRNLVGTKITLHKIPPSLDRNAHRPLVSTTVTDNDNNNNNHHVDLDVFWGKLQEQLHNGDLLESQETYRELKAAARQQQKTDPTARPDQESKWQLLREELFHAWIARSKDAEIQDTASLIDAASQAHMILEDLDERLSIYAMVIPLKDEDKSQGIVEEALDDVLPLEKTMVFSAALDVLEAWARASYSLRLFVNNNNVQAKSDLDIQRMGRGMPQRAQFLLQQLERLSAKNNIPVPYYEAVIKTWACSNEHLRGVHAEQVFRQIPQYAVTPAAMHWIIRAWAWSRDPRAAFTATGHLMKRLRYYSNDSDGEMEPMLEDYEIIFDAWSRAEDKMAPTKALSLWSLWQSSIENGTTIVKPSLNVYRSLLKTATTRPNQPDLGHRVVDVLLTRMREEMIIPDTACYESAICVWKNCALHPDVPDDRQACLRRITTLLTDLRSAYLRRTADGTTGVTTKALNHVLESLQVSEHSQRGQLAEALLKEMEECLQRGEDQAAPNPDSYRFVIDVYQTISSKDRIPLAKTILLRCKDTILQGNVSKATRKEAVEVLNSFVRLCATTPQPVPSEAGVSILREAIRAVERFRSGCRVIPNQTTYAYLLQAMSELVSDESHRSKLVDQVFRLCCQDGMVDDGLLKQLMHVTTPEQFQRMVVASSETVEGVKVIPESWSRNVLGGRVVSADGRRVRPLTIDGRLTETKAMQEFKMRRLRDKRNRKLLQGGRWDRSKDEMQS